MLPLVAAPFAPLSPVQRFGVVVLFAVAVGFGGIVEMRSAFLTRRMTDLDVYLRAAWAIRVGTDPYAATDNNGLHYHYPPLLAVLLVPLADSPPGADRARALPFPASVAIWYALSLLCLAMGTHSLARALEQTSHDRRVQAVPHGCRRWWALRLLPILVCITPIGGTLARGQVNLVVLALLCAMAAATLRGRSFRAGLWLSAAICIKVIPAFLVLYPLWRRDRRCLAGCGLGLVIGLALIPAAVLGPARALDLAQTWVRSVAAPALTERGDRTRDKELLNITTTDNQSIVAVVHNALYAHLDRAQRPPHPSLSVRLTHWLVAALLTGITLWAGSRRAASTAAELLFIGLLTATMLFVSPVCHLHYFAFMLPLMMGLVALGLEDQGSNATIQRLARWLAAFYPVANALPHLPGLQSLRDHGLAMIATLALWLLGTLRLRQLDPRSGHDAE